MPPPHLNLPFRPKKSEFGPALATNDPPDDSISSAPRPNSNSLHHHDYDHARRDHGLRNQSTIQQILASIEASQATPSTRIENAFAPKDFALMDVEEDAMFFRLGKTSGLTSRVIVSGDIGGVPVFVKKSQCITDKPLEENENRDLETSMIEAKKSPSTDNLADFSDHLRDAQSFPAKQDKSKEHGHKPNQFMGSQLKWLRWAFSQVHPESVAIVVQLEVQITATNSPKGPGLTFLATLERSVHISDLWRTIKKENYFFLRNARLQDSTPKRWSFQLRRTFYETPHAPLVWSAATRGIDDYTQVDRAWQDFLEKCVEQGRESAQRLLDEARFKCDRAVIKLSHAPYTVEGHPREVPDLSHDTKARVYGKMHIGF
ncbi:hypothetical protein PV10_09034 [Exophiala mesophila]|uniref:Uncharacterized protein n=1 Tax=Exophiala mesophila TaxID=212818 RepID=A0A0D1ZMW6_EXOME|nr:uncharacterized protein PV10_09034 [Exophiala mesophila]KIV88108.1 hypothetical protein PV10_09034 [Exophiala mesophila]